MQYISSTGSGLFVHVLKFSFALIELFQSLIFYVLLIYDLPMSFSKYKVLSESAKFCDMWFYRLLGCIALSSFYM